MCLALLAVCSSQSTGRGGPAPFTVIASPGDGTDGARFVHQFLHGENPECVQSPTPSACARQPFLSAPDWWTLRTVHNQSPFCGGDCRPFFRDSVSLGASDDDRQQGLEHGHLAFYAGHGEPRKWHVRAAKQIGIDEVSLGDILPLYLWLLSCQVMAHGPEDPIPGAEDHSDFVAPHKFDPQNTGHRNLFRDLAQNYGTPERPRVPLHANLRLICGASTLIGGGTSFPIAPVWHYKLLAELPVADSFILGLAEGYRVPLCIARGGDGPEQSPLYDPDFLAARNGYDPRRLYIQYPIHLPLVPGVREALAAFGFSGTPTLENGQQAELRPVLDLDATPLPAPLDRVDWSELPRLPFGFRGASLQDIQTRTTDGNGEPPLSGVTEFAGVSLDARDVCIKRQEASGAVVVSWRPSGAAGVPGADAIGSVAVLRRLFGLFGLGREQWTGGKALPPDISPVTPLVKALVMHIDGASEIEVLAETLDRQGIGRHSKCFYLALEGVVEVDGVHYPVLGEGGEWLFAYCPRGPFTPAAGEDGGACGRSVPPVLTLAWVGRSVVRSRPQETIDVESARLAAREKLKARYIESYVKPDYRFGYKAAPIHCSQRSMYLVYEFDFLSRLDDGSSAEVTIEVPAHQLSRPIEDDWQCSPETADGD